MEAIKKHLLQLETELLKPEIRKSTQKIKGILASDFIEFCSNGREYYYKSGDVFQQVNDDRILQWGIHDFNIKELSNDCVLVLYTLIKHDENDDNLKYSLRSSIWKNYNGEWKILFHQGTLSAKEGNTNEISKSSIHGNLVTE